jgi:hypothetical protein
MSRQDLKIMLEEIDDTHEIVLRVEPRDGHESHEDALMAMWAAAQHDVDVAYAAWEAERAAEAHAVYLAALDREAAAAATLAQAR